MDHGSDEETFLKDCVRDEEELLLEGNEDALELTEILPHCVSRFKTAYQLKYIGRNNVLVGARSNELQSMK
jgi:hypothetical protein